MITWLFLGITVGGLVAMLAGLLSDVDFFFGTGFFVSMVGLVLMLVSVVWNELDDPERGVVIEKQFTPRHIQCAKGCWTVPDTWELELDDNGNTGWVKVKQRTYNNFPIGSTFEGKG